MTEFMTRREMREAERKGLSVSPVKTPDPIQPVLEAAAVIEAPDQIEVAISISEPEPQQPQRFLSRRELREAERKGKKPAEFESAAITPIASDLPEVEIPDLEAASAEIAQITITDVSTLDLPPADFTGNNLFAEPSTQSIVLDVAPEAIALPIETGEIAVTGSIAVLTEPTTGSVTAGLDGLELDNADRQDAVTGVISIVEPVSALDVINARVNVGVVPKSVLRKGWWRPWVIALASIVMAVAAIIATVTILGAIGA